MREPYEETLDLDCYNAAEDISTREGEALIYIRGDNGIYMSSIAGDKEELANTIISCMFDDDEFAEIVNTSSRVYIESKNIERGELN